MSGRRSRRQVREIGQGEEAGDSSGRLVRETEQETGQGDGTGDRSGKRSRRQVRETGQGEGAGNTSVPCRLSVARPARWRLSACVPRP